IARIAGHASASFATWAPNLYTYYEDHLDDLLDNDQSLKRNFPKSVWAACSINFGPRTVTREHRDYANLPFGWCSVTALGNFNAKTGGHLVLCSLNHLVDFPAGSTAHLPSAAIAHCNTPISKHEECCSIAQYTAGGIFRWVEQGFQPSASYVESLGKEELEEEIARMTERCKLGLSLYSTLDSLAEDQQARRVKLAETLDT
ncbi:hypothetical protein BDN70DRAFT_819426, partial [Pholiota conissans]